MLNNLLPVNYESSSLRSRKGFEENLQKQLAENLNIDITSRT